MARKGTTVPWPLPRSYPEPHVSIPRPRKHFFIRSISISASHIRPYLPCCPFLSHFHYKILQAFLISTTRALFPSTSSSIFWITLIISLFVQEYTDLLLMHNCQLLCIWLIPKRKLRIANCHWQKEAVTALLQSCDQQNWRNHNAAYT
jgi:hypothetical protein